MYNSYTEEQISSLNPTEAMRHRPTVYIGEVRLHGMMHLLKEVLTNSLDEASGGYGSEIEITIDFKSDIYGPRFTVRDYGRGIPLGKLPDIGSKLNTSGKYGDITGKGGYKISAGLNGAGIFLTNAISRNFTISSMRDGEKWTTFYDKGVSTKPMEKMKYSGQSGVTVSYTPDIEVMLDTDISGCYNEYMTYFEIMSYVHSGIKFIVTWGDHKPVKFHHPNGLSDYFNKTISDRKIKIMGRPHFVRYCTEDGTVGYNIAYGFAEKGGGFTISYVNGISTVDGGVHVSTLSEAMGVLTTVLNKGSYIPKNLQNNVKITGNEIRESMFAIVIADKMNPKFDTQIKSKLTSEDFKSMVITKLKEQISEWISKNPDTIDKIGKHVSLLAKIKYESSKIKDNILKAGSNSKTDLFKNIDVSKFSDCNKNDPERTESPRRCGF